MTIRGKAAARGRRKAAPGDVCPKIGSGAAPCGGKDVCPKEGSYLPGRSRNVYNDGFQRNG